MMRLSKWKWLSLPAAGYIELFRNTPALVQLIWIYYCLPILTGLDLSALVSCTIALMAYGSAYIAEIFRAGIKSIDPGQVEAARSSGLSYLQTMREVVLPQAIRRMIPPLVNESVTLLKFSSLVSILGVADLTYQAQVLSTTTFRPIEIFTFIAVVYFILCSALAWGAQLLERRMAVADR
jgi:ABC-type amino acid transport system permease subunit